MAEDTQLTDSVQQIADAWVAADGGTSTVSVPVYGQQGANVQITEIQTSGNVVSIWTSSDTTLPPDFVIVNPPTQVATSATESFSDPLGALAVIIDGASQ